MGSPQVAKGSGSAAEGGCSHPGPSVWLPHSLRGGSGRQPRKHPNCQPIWLPRLGLVHTHALDLQRDTQKKYRRVPLPLPHTILTSGAQATIALITLRGPMLTQERTWGSWAEAAGGSGAISRCLRGKQSRYFPKLLSEATPSHPGPDLRVPWPDLPCRARTAQSRIPGSHFVRNTVGQAGLAELGQFLLCCPCTSVAGAQGPGAQALAGCCLWATALTCSL